MKPSEPLVGVSGDLAEYAFHSLLRQILQPSNVIVTTLVQDLSTGHLRLCRKLWEPTEGENIQ